MVIEPHAAARQLALSVGLPGEPMPVRTDPGTLRPILINVLANAVKFTDAGGTALAVRLPLSPPRHGAPDA